MVCVGITAGYGLSRIGDWYVENGTMLFGATADILYGSALDHALESGQWPDVLYGYAGWDSLNAGDGDNTFTAVAGAIRSTAMTDCICQWQMHGVVWLLNVN